MNKAIAKRIRKIRREKELSQRELAEHLGKTPQAVSELELGNAKVGAAELQQLADYMNKPIEYFYGVESEEMDDTEEAAIADE